MLQARNYETALQQGAKIIGKDMSSAVQSDTFVIAIAGTTTQNVFYGQTTAPTSGTIVGFTLVQNGASGSAVLSTTTAGTVAIISYGSAAGTFAGTQTLNASVTAGDTVIVYNTGAIGTGGSGGGTSTAFVVFQTFN